MKKYILFTLFFILANSLFGQTLDSAFIKCLYRLTYTEDLNRPQKVNVDEMLLLVGNNTAAFYSYTNYLADSLKKANPSKYESARTIDENGNMTITASRNRPRITGNTEFYYINRQTEELRCKTKLLSRYYEYTEKIPNQNWEISDEKQDILGYVCQKATCDFGGRTWTAWFATEIPINEGPWKLRGLPGLILKAEDSELHYQFECASVERKNKDKPAIPIDTKNEYRKISKQDAINLKATYYNNPSAAMSSMLGGDASITLNISPSGGEREYNHIERRERGEQKSFLQ